jgi:ADP-heptose:LPS heptosyltransferase
VSRLSRIAALRDQIALLKFKAGIKGAPLAQLQKMVTTLAESLPKKMRVGLTAKAESIKTVEDIPQLFNDATAALDRADAVLCHDSMPAHLAAALGKPVITIFGSGEPDWFAPWNNRDRVVQLRVCPLHPCIDRCGMDRYLCLEAVEVGDVLAQLQRLNAAP